MQTELDITRKINEMIKITDAIKFAEKISQQNNEKYEKGKESIQISFIWTTIMQLKINTKDYDPKWEVYSNEYLTNQAAQDVIKKSINTLSHYKQEHGVKAIIQRVGIKLDTLNECILEINNLSHLKRTTPYTDYPNFIKFKDKNRDPRINNSQENSQEQPLKLTPLVGIPTGVKKEAFKDTHITTIDEFILQNTTIKNTYDEMIKRNEEQIVRNSLNKANENAIYNSFPTSNPNQTEETSYDNVYDTFPTGCTDPGDETEDFEQ